mgnify:CR=1 FL=1
MKLAERLQGRRFVRANAGRYGSGSSEILARLVPPVPGPGRRRDLGGHRRRPGVLRVRPARSRRRSAASRSPSPRPCWYPTSRPPRRTRATHPAPVRPGDDPRPAPALPFSSATARSGPLGHGAATRDLSRAWRRAWHLVRRDLERYDAVVYSMPEVRPARSRFRCSSSTPSDRSASARRTASSRRADTRGPRPARHPSGPASCSQICAPTRAPPSPMAALTAFRLVRKYVPCAAWCWPGWGADRQSGGQRRDLTELARPPARIRTSTCCSDAARTLHRGSTRCSARATVVLHLPQREGFGLARRRGDVEGQARRRERRRAASPAQVLSEVTGYTVGSVEGAAFRIRQLLQSPDLAAPPGRRRARARAPQLPAPAHLADYAAPRPDDQ